MESYSRILKTLDVKTMQKKHVTIVGGGYGIAVDLARSGIGGITLVDFDRVSFHNPARQDLDYSDIDRLKTIAIKDHIYRVNPDTKVISVSRDFCSICREEFDDLFSHTDLFIMATDFFPAQARGNIEALRLNKPAVFIGMYAEGRAGEIIYHLPTDPAKACFRCVASARYESFMNNQEKVRVNSGGATIFDLHIVDAIAGQISLGILTRGANNRMGQLIDQLAGRNLLQVKIDPNYRLGNKDIFTQYLGKNPANFSFNTIAITIKPEKDCPDCS